MCPGGGSRLPSGRGKGLARYPAWKDHGYVFEVDPYDRRANRAPQPVKALGRYAHEAVVVDPKRGHHREPRPVEGRRVRRPGQHHRLPYGGLIIAEDGEGVQHLIGATDGGHTYPIARNECNVGTVADPDFSEFAGVVFSPDGRTLYAGIQTPGIMFAITGPWKRQSGRH